MIFKEFKVLIYFRQIEMGVKFNREEFIGVIRNFGEHSDYRYDSMLDSIDVVSVKHKGYIRCRFDREDIAVVFEEHCLVTLMHYGLTIEDNVAKVELR